MTSNDLRLITPILDFITVCLLLSFIIIIIYYGRYYIIGMHFVKYVLVVENPWRRLHYENYNAGVLLQGEMLLILNSSSHFIKIQSNK